jgi:putative ATP-binding cassette transporter
VFVFLSVVAALSATLILALINVAAADIATQSASVRLIMLFLLATALFAVSQRWVMATAGREVEELVERLRLRVTEEVRRADLVSLDSIGRASLFGALTQEMQAISQTASLLVGGLQQGILLVCISFYLAWLSLTAFLIAAGFGTLAVLVYVVRMQALNQRMAEASRHESSVFQGLSDLLDGFKEVTMHRGRSDALMTYLTAASEGALRSKTEIKRQWAHEFVLIQAIFYGLLGVMVFMVPLFTEDYHRVAVKVTTVTLFLIGPIAFLAQSIPAITDAAAAVRGIQALYTRLQQTMAAKIGDETVLPLPETIREITLDAVRFTYRDAQGQASFTVGPASATFRASEITFSSDCSVWVRLTLRRYGACWSGWRSPTRLRSLTVLSARLISQRDSVSD